MNNAKATNKEHFENHLDDNPKWFAVYTNYKREKIAAKQLSQQNIQVYLPLLLVTKKYVRKVKKLELPLISNYLFVKISKKEYTKVLQCTHVLSFIKFSKNLISIPNYEIEIIRRVLGTQEVLSIDNNFQKGDEVEVIGGEMTGLKGVFIKKENNQYLSVQLSNIGVAINISIATHLLRKIKPVSTLNLKRLETTKRAYSAR